MPPPCFIDIFRRSDAAETFSVMKRGDRTGFWFPFDFVFLFVIDIFDDEEKGDTRQTLPNSFSV